MISIEAIDMTGENVYQQSFESGRSKLKWPIDVKTLGIELGLTGKDLFDVEFLAAAEPWVSDSHPMKDYDYINESAYPGRQSHDGVDIFSESKVESKAFVIDGKSHLFPVRTRFISAGLTAGYRYEEYDYRASDTRQTGYGPWQDQTSKVSGPTSLYTIEYEIFSLGLSLRSDIGDTLVLTLDACALPFVHVKDEDNHIRRTRISKSTTSGSGYQTSFSGLYKISRNWFISSGFTLSSIETSGHSDQFWYGDDPATPYFNDTGEMLKGIDTEINQKCYRFNLGASRHF
ncbi:MAG TPA: omptin family outer membrane protease [Desulfomonilia bacterium]|nr:omptin family outer membrane protease [Desulfomonilia bacterium]